MVDRVLTRLQNHNPDLAVTQIDVVTHPLTAWKNGIRMIPALKAGNKVVAGVFLRGEDIRKFIADVKARETGNSNNV